MNIKYLQNDEKLKIRSLYEKVFEDSDDFIDYFFNGPIYDNEVLVAEEDGSVRSMLQLIPKRMNYQNKECCVHYIYAVATDEAYRGQGLMEQLLNRAFMDLKAKGEPFTYLVPVNPKVYKKFGFKVSYLKPKYELHLEPEQIKVTSPNTMDQVILSKFCSQMMPAKYDTYLVHDEAYFEKLFKELIIDHGYLVYHMTGRRLNGYTLVASDHTVLETMFLAQPKELTLKGYLPRVMVKMLAEDCRVGRLCINDET